MSVQRVIATGTTSPIETGPTVRYDDRDGRSTEYSYEGTRTECNAKAEELIALKARSVMVGPSGNGNWRVEAQFAGSPQDEGGPDADEPTNLHELDTIAEQVPWNKSARVRSFFNTARVEEIIAIVAHYVSTYQSGQTIKTNPAISEYANAQANLSAALALVPSIGAGEIIDAKKLMAHVVFYGFESFYNFNSIYSRTITAANYTQVQAAYTGVGQVWTSYEVVAQEGLPESEWFGLDANVLWLKSPPRVSASAGGRTQIAYSYTSAPTFSKFQASAYSSATLID